MRAALAVVLWGLLGMACTQSGAVRIVIDAPSAPELTPIDDRLATLMLRVDVDGMDERVETRAIVDRTRSVSLGDIPVEPNVRLSLAAENAAGRLIGFGRGATPIDVKLGPTIDVPIRMRRPFAYVAGGGQLATFDATLEPGQPYAGGLGVAGTPVVTAPTPDGADLVVIVPGQLLLVSTATHTPEDVAPVAIAADATDVAVSPDSQWAVVGHATGVTLVNLPSVRDGSAAPVFLGLGAVGAVSVAGGTAFALLGAASDDSCGAPSSVQSIDLASMTPNAAVPLGVPARDLAADPSGGTVVLAIPCRSAVSRIDATSETGSLADVLMVQNPTSVAIGEGRVWAMGHVDVNGGAHLVLAQAALDGSGASTVDLPVPDERADSDDFTMSGQGAEVRISADQIEALDLAVLPDGARIGVLIAAAYHANQSQQEFLPGVPLIPAIDVTTWEYQLLDAPTATPLQRMRTRCDLQWAHNGFLDAFHCTRAQGQDQAASEYVPTHVSVLYGDR